MKPLSIKATEKTPGVLFHKNLGVFIISGASITENSIAFYESLIHWLKEYSLSPNHETTLICFLDCFNSSSIKALLLVFRELMELQKTGHAVSVNWYYERDNSSKHDLGNSLKDILDIPFHLICKEAIYTSDLTPHYMVG
jgi:hypothetical protein